MRYFNGKTKIMFDFFQEKSGDVQIETHFFLTEIDLKITHNNF